MKLSSRVRYALLALLELASHYDQGNFGYLLAREPRQIELLSVMVGWEGNKKSEENKASSTPENSVLEEVWLEATTAALAVLQSYTLQALREKRDQGQQSNPMFYI